jgi:hypothetical protein
VHERSELSCGFVLGVVRDVVVFENLEIKTAFFTEVVEGDESFGGDFWFPDKEQESASLTEAQYAKSICRRCTHRSECAEWGIHKENFGIWGGLSPRERFRIRQQRGIRLNQEDGVA